MVFARHVLPAAGFVVCVAATCFNPDGSAVTDLAYQPCNQVAGSVSMCCGTNRTVTASAPLVPDVCQPDGLCLGAYLGVAVTWRAGCTDKSWDSPNCLKGVCDGGTTGGSSDSYSPLSQCSDGTWCCGVSTEASTCCTAKKGFAIAATIGQTSTPSTSSATPTPTQSQTAPTTTSAVSITTFTTSSASASSSSSSEPLSTQSSQTSQTSRVSRASQTSQTSQALHASQSSTSTTSASQSSSSSTSNSAASETSSTNTTTTAAQKDSSNKSKTAMNVGLGVGIPLFSALVGGVMAFIIIRRRRSRDQEAVMELDSAGIMKEMPDHGAMQSNQDAEYYQKYHNPAPHYESGWEKPRAELSG